MGIAEWREQLKSGDVSYVYSNSIPTLSKLLANYQRLLLGCVEASKQAITFDPAKFRNQKITRWKALDEIYQIYIPLHFGNQGIAFPLKKKINYSVDRS